MSELQYDPLADWLAGGPQRDWRIASNQVLQGLSSAGQEASDNLLDKALRAIMHGDEDRARAFLERAAALPFDEHERVRPARWQAHLSLHNIVADAFDEADDNDDRWLDALFAVWDATGGDLDHDFSTILWGFRLEHRLSQSQLRRVNRRVSPENHEDLLDAYAAATPELDVPVIRALLAASLAYAAEIERLRQVSSAT